MSDVWNVFQHAQEDRPVKSSWVLNSMIDSNDKHLTPIQDTLEHDLSRNCFCGPAETVNDKQQFVYVHNAVDGREAPSTY